MDDLLLSPGDRVTWNAHTLTDAPYGTEGTVEVAERRGPYLSAHYEIQWDTGSRRSYGAGHVGETGLMLSAKSDAETP